MPTGELPKSAVWANIETMYHRQSMPGITMWPAAGENMMIIFVRLEPGAEVPPHHHVHEQGGTVIEGSIVMTIDEESRELRRGDIYIAPPNSVHSASAGPDGALVIDVFSPPRADYLPPAE